MDKATPTPYPASANIHERLLSVPKDAILKIDTPNPLGVDTRSIPVGAMCHEAAAALRAEVERLAAQAAPILGDKQVCASNVDDKTAPVVQVGEYPPLPEPDAFVAMNYEGSIVIPPQDFPKWGSAYKVFTADQMRAYVDAYVAMRKAKS